MTVAVPLEQDHELLLYKKITHQYCTLLYVYNHKIDFLRIRVQCVNGSPVNPLGHEHMGL